MQQDTNQLGQPIGAPVPNWKPPPWPSREPMEGRLCRLVALSPKLHAAELHSANASSPSAAVWTYLPYGPFDSDESYRNWIEQKCQGEDPLFYAILDGPTGRAVGVASYLRIAPESGSIEVGHIQYSSILQRTPAASEAMFLMMQRAFELGYRRYEWKCDALNAPSRAAALRLGFFFEGIFRQATVVKGRNRDTAWYSVVDTEWPLLRGAFLHWLDPRNFDPQGRQIARLSTLTKEAMAQLERFSVVSFVCDKPSAG